jgi:hypothetical protein
LSCHSVAVVLTLVQTKQIRINTHKRNNTKNTEETIQNEVNTSTHINKKKHTLQNPTYTHPHITKPNIHTPTHYKTQHTHTHTLQNPTYIHPHITQQVKTNSTRYTKSEISTVSQVPSV